MNKNDLVEALAPRLGGRAAAALAVGALVDVVLREVAAGGQVGITGFGTFEAVERAPRTGRNPHTGQAVPIAATRRPRFRPGSYFTAVVADPDQLPATGLAGARVGTAEASGPGGRPDSPGAGAAAGGSGAPPSIRRSAPRSGETAGEEPAPARRSRPRTSGTPASVRADRSAPDRRDREERAGREPALGGRLLLGGEDITRSMIRAKKAELERAKNDAVAGPGKGRKKGKKGKKGGKKKDAG